MEVTTLGIDLAKNVFQLHGRDAQGQPVLSKRLSRAALPEFMATLPPCLIGMETCGGAHYWARKFQAFGHEVRLIQPAFVKPYVKSNKNDRADAEAICEALTRPTMRFVPLKSVAQQDIQSMHRIRQRLVGQRTALVNQIRGLLAEYGIVLPKQVAQVRRGLPALLEAAATELTSLGRELFTELYEELQQLDTRIEQAEQKIQRVFKADAMCQKLAAVEGIGPLSATALVAAIGNAHLFRTGRELAAWLGLVPRHHASGQRTTLLGISKRGDPYLRTLLIHGARSVVYRTATKQDGRSQWIERLKQRRGINRTCVAVANKNARIVWALMTKPEAYRPAA